MDDGTREIVGHLALTRRRPPSSTETQSAFPGNEQKVLDFFNAKVLAAVGAAVSKLTQNTRDVDHDGKNSHPINMRKKLINLGLDFRADVYHSQPRTPSSRHRKRALMEHVFDKAKAAEIPVMLSTEPQIYAFFIKYGLKHTKHVDFDLAEWAPPYCGFGISRLATMVCEI